MIHPLRSLLALMIAAGAALVFAAAAPDHGHANKTAPADAPDAAWLAQAKADYPLETCAVAGEDLGSMGEPFDYVHQEAGQPDRLVRMCCEGCLKKFKKEPAKYLARIDAAKNSPEKKSTAQPACCAQ